MIRGDILGLTGYGLSTELSDGDINFVVDVIKQEVDGVSFADFIK